MVNQTLGKGILCVTSSFALQASSGQELDCFYILYCSCIPQLNTMFSSSVNTEQTEGQRPAFSLPSACSRLRSCGTQKGELWVQLQTPKDGHYKAFLSSVQSLSRVGLFVTPSTAACQVSLSITNSRSPPKPMSIESVMPSNHLILCHPLLLLPSIFPSIRVFSNESALRIRWPKYWGFSFNITPSNEY